MWCEELACGQKSFYLKVQIIWHADDQRYGFGRLRLVGSR